MSATQDTEVLRDDNDNEKTRTEGGVQRSEFSRPVEILLVEDNPGDVRLTQEALRDGNVPHRLSVVQDGEEALSYLRREKPYSNAARPDLILLDLNLPKKDGRQVLEEVKKDNELREIPVLVLTTSRAEYDISSAYDLQANCYIQKPVDLNQKPVDLNQFWTIVRWIEKFWLNTAALPSQANARTQDV